MNNIIDENGHLKLHIKKRDNILLQLQHVYTSNSYHRSSEIGYSIVNKNLICSNAAIERSFSVFNYIERLFCTIIHVGNVPCNLSERNGKSQSSRIEDLFIEMYGKAYDGNTDCYRCKHFLNIPRNLSAPCEQIADYTRQCEADLNFVQAVVWLKSATTFMKDISIEQFHLAFHKQWANICFRRTDSDGHNQDSVFGIQGSVYERSSSIDSLSDNQKTAANFDSDSEDANSVYLLCNRLYNEKRINQNSNALIEKRNNSDISDSSQRDERFFNLQPSMQNYGTLYHQIIPDSDGECSSSSDMFKDSSESEESSKAMLDETDYKLLEKKESTTKKSVEIFPLNSRSSSISKRTSLNTKSDLAAITDAADSLDTTLFNEDCTLSRENCSPLKRRLSSKSNKRIVSSPAKTNNSNFPNKIKNPIVPSLRIGNTDSLQKDSAYDTYQLNAEHTPTSNSIQLSDDISIFASQKIENITPYQKGGSVNDACDSQFLRLDVMEKDEICDRNRESGLSHETGDLTRIHYSQGDEDLNEHTGYKGPSNKRKRLGSSCESEVRKQTEKQEEKISSQWLKFTLDTLNVDDVALQSVKVILSVLQNESITGQYMRLRCWKNTLEEQAVNAVLNFCDVFEAENKTNVCTQEILQVVMRMLDRIIERPNLNQVTTFTHQISIILQLCTSMQVCIETINYLTEKLKSYENVLISLTNCKKANICNVINQLHIIFYALNICLQKYRLVFVNERNEQLEEDTIPPIFDLWRKQLKFEGSIVEDSVETRERRWLMILDNFTVVATEHFVQFAEKSRKLANLLTYVKPLLF